MLSFRECTQAEGIASARQLANHFNVPSPFSLRTVIAAHKIDKKYTELGRKNSPLGRALENSAMVIKDGIVSSNFRGGNITFSSQGASAFVTHVTRVLYKGIHCFGKSEATDEPYAIVGVYAPDARDKVFTTKFPIDRDSYVGFVASTDEAESQDVSLDWSPQTLAITSIVMEHDSGDPDRVAAKAEESLKKAAADAGVDAADIQVFTGILDDLGIPNMIADVLGVGDDLIGGQTAEFKIDDLVPKRPMQKFGNIEFNFDSPLLSDGNASYKLYYEIFVQEIDPPKML